MSDNQENIQVEGDVENENLEPEPKKAKVEIQKVSRPPKLESRLNGILSCAVCLDLPTKAVFQVCSSRDSRGPLLCRPGDGATRGCFQGALS